MAINFGFHVQYDLGFYMLLLACVFDFFDGFAARLQKTESNIGKDLDSLADVVSFGVAPSIMLLTMLEKTNFSYPYIAFVLPLFAALRLAKFNNDAEQNYYFKGLNGNDILKGFSGNDSLYGGVGDDQIYGGLGKDKLYGEQGADSFVFSSAFDSAVANFDIIYDFEQAFSKVI